MIGYSVSTRCIGVLGGSFDPVHIGHVALGELCIKTLGLSELRVIPAGSPWQKNDLHTSAEHRVEMVRRAFADQAVPVTIDQQEISRGALSYTIDTLRALRSELGTEVSIVFLLGADQLQQLHTWRQWQNLFDYAHVCVASRTGFATDASHMHAEVAETFSRRSASPENIRSTPCGLTYLATGLAVDISATQIRTAFASGHEPSLMVPSAVLDYIKQHHLYQRPQN